MKKALDNLGQAMLKPVNKAAIILLGLYTVVWGLWVINPFWNTFGSAALYMVLGTVAPEYFWGGLAICCGLITTYGAVHRGYKALVIGAGVSGWHWFMIGIFYLMGDISNTGGITALTFAIYACFIWLNLRVNHKGQKKEMCDILS